MLSKKQDSLETLESNIAKEEDLLVSKRDREQSLIEQHTAGIITDELELSKILGYTVLTEQFTAQNGQPYASHVAFNNAEYNLVINVLMSVLTSI